MLQKLIKSNIERRFMKIQETHVSTIRPVYVLIFNVKHISESTFSSLIRDTLKMENFAVVQHVCKQPTTSVDNRKRNFIIIETPQICYQLKKNDLFTK